jgi:hypothetical protein
MALHVMCLLFLSILTKPEFSGKIFITPNLKFHEIHTPPPSTTDPISSILTDRRMNGHKTRLIVLFRNLGNACKAVSLFSRWSFCEILIKVF